MWGSLNIWAYVKCAIMWDFGLMHSHPLSPYAPLVSHESHTLVHLLSPQESLEVVLTEFLYLPWKEARAAQQAQCAQQQGAAEGVAGEGATQGGSQAVADAHKAEDVQVG